MLHQNIFDYDILLPAFLNRVVNLLFCVSYLLLIFIFYNRIDAINEFCGVARFFNDDPKEPNMLVKPIISEDELPVPLFIARRRIEVGEELQYKYGPGLYPWRMKS